MSIDLVIDMNLVSNNVDIWTNIQSTQQPASVLSVALIAAISSGSQGGNPSNLELIKANGVSVDNTGISGERQVAIGSMTALFSISEKKHSDNCNVFGAQLVAQVEGAVDEQLREENEGANLADMNENESENENNDDNQFGNDDEKIDILYEEDKSD